MSGEPERMDNPNQQAVRPDASGPADAGEGGSQHAAAKKPTAKERREAAAAEKAAED